MHKALLNGLLGIAIGGIAILIVWVTLPSPESPWFFFAAFLAIIAVSAAVEIIQGLIKRKTKKPEFRPNLNITLNITPVLCYVGS